MSLLTPLGLLGLIGIIVLIIIYIIKPNFQNKFISSTFVWKLSLKYKKKKLPINKLRNILIFICQVLIITAATFILAQAFIDNSAEVESGDTIIVIDTSASMHSEIGGQSRFSRAVLKALEDAKASFENDNRVSVIIASAKAEYLIRQLSPDSADQLYTAFEELLSNPESVYTYGEPDIAGAMALAEQITEFTENVSVTLYTDMTYYETDKVTVCNVNDIGEWNAAILDVRATLVENYYRIEIDVASYGKDAEIRLLCQIKNFNESDTNFEIETVASCTGDEITTIVFAAKNDQLSESEKDLITEELKLFSYEQISVRLFEEDSLSYDNKFYLYGGQKPTLKILYSSPLPNNYFTAALLIAQDALSDSWNVELDEVALKQGDAIIVEGYDLYIYEHTMPKTMPSDGVVLCVNPSSMPVSTGIKLSNSIKSSGGEIFLSPDETHEIMNNIDASKISVTLFTNVASYDDFTTLMKIEQYPLLLLKDEPYTKVMVIPFSLHYSNLAMLPEFPLMMMNTLNYFFPTTVRDTVYEVGDKIEIDSRSEELEIAAPDKTYEVNSFPTELDATLPGTYVLTQRPMSGIPTIESIYVKVPSAESDINHIEAELINPYFYEDEGALDVDLLFYLALAMVALLFFEWWLKSREQI